MYLCIKIVDVIPEDVICFAMTRLDDNWYVARMSDYSEIYAVLEYEREHIVFIVWRNQKIVRLLRVHTDDRTSEYLCIKCDYKFFIDTLAFDGYYDIENAENIINHLLEHVDDS